MEWPDPFSPIEHSEDKPAFEAELQRELKPGHPLFGLSVAAIGRRYDQDDVLFELLDGSGRVAVVHLTSAGEREKPPWPGTALFDSFAEWVEAAREANGQCKAAPNKSLNLTGAAFWVSARREVLAAAPAS